MKAHEFLSEGVKTLASRAEVRDAPDGERSAERAAKIVAAWEGVEYDASHIWRVLASVKMARSVQGRCHVDDYLDMAAYCALLGEAEYDKAREGS